MTKTPFPAGPSQCALDVGAFTQPMPVKRLSNVQFVFAPLTTPVRSRRPVPVLREPTTQ